MNKKQYWILVIILGSLTALTPFSVDMYLPAFKTIAEEFKTVPGRVALSLGSYFVGISIGQLAYGPLLDKFGRKKPLYVGLTIYLFASLACAFFTNTLEALIVYRFLQAIGGCVAMVAAIAMVRDQFPVKDGPKVFALLVLILGASPLLAPTIGSQLAVQFGWRSIFLVLFCMGAVIFLACIFFLKDPYEPNKSLSLKPGPILSSFKEVLVTPQFYTYSIAGALAFAALFSYVAGSPILFMNYFGLTEQQFGWVFAGISVSFITASQFNALLVKKYSSDAIAKVCFTILPIIGFIMLLLTVTGWLSFPLCLVCLIITMGTIGIVNPNTSTLAMAPFSRNAGTASALMGCLQMSAGAMVAITVGLFNKPSALPLACCLGGCAMLSALIYFLAKRNIKTLVTGNESTDTPSLH